MEFKASVDALEEIMEYLRAQARLHEAPSALIPKIELACEEAIMNVISYAYKGTQGTLKISCDKRGKRLEITLRDQGVPFNPMDAEIDPQLDIPIQERTIGGVGIFLMRKIIDEASYQREGKENVLRLVFILP